MRTNRSKRNYRARARAVHEGKLCPAGELRQSYVDGEKNEQSPLGKTIFGKMIENCDIACKNSVPICQDCGMAIVFVEVGQDVHITGGLLEDAVNEGVRQGYVTAICACPSCATRCSTAAIPTTTRRRF